MMNIEGAADLAKRAINHEVIAITNCCQLRDGQGLLFMYRDICPQAQRLVSPCVIEAIPHSIKQRITIQIRLLQKS